MISQQRRDVKTNLKFSTKKPATTGTKRVLKAYLVLLWVWRYCVITGLFVVSKAGFFIFKKLLSHNTTTLSTTISRKGRKRTLGSSGAARAGSSRICRRLPRFAEIIPGLPQLTLDNPAETWYNTGVGQGPTRARRNHTNCTKPRNNTWHTRPGSGHRFCTSLLHIGARGTI